MGIKKKEKRKKRKKKLYGEKVYIFAQIRRISRVLESFLGFFIIESTRLTCEKRWMAIVYIEFICVNESKSFVNFDEGEKRGEERKRKNENKQTV